MTIYRTWVRIEDPSDDPAKTEPSNRAAILGDSDTSDASESPAELFSLEEGRELTNKWLTEQEKEHHTAQQSRADELESAHQVVIYSALDSLTILQFDDAHFKAQLFLVTSGISHYHKGVAYLVIAYVSLRDLEKGNTPDFDIDGHLSAALGAFDFALYDCSDHSDDQMTGINNTDLDLFTRWGNLVQSRFDVRHQKWNIKSRQKWVLKMNNLADQMFERSLGWWSLTGRF